MNAHQVSSLTLLPPTQYSRAATPGSVPFFTFNVIDTETLLRRLEFGQWCVLSCCCCCCYSAQQQHPSWCLPLEKYGKAEQQRDYKLRRRRRSVDGEGLHSRLVAAAAAAAASGAAGRTWCRGRRQCGRRRCGRRQCGRRWCGRRAVEQLVGWEEVCGIDVNVAALVLEPVAELRPCTVRVELAAQALGEEDPGGLGGAVVRRHATVAPLGAELRADRAAGRVDTIGARVVAVPWATPGNSAYRDRQLL